MCLDTVVVATACIWVVMDGIRTVTYEITLLRYFTLNNNNNNPHIVRKSAMLHDDINGTVDAGVHCRGPVLERCQEAEPGLGVTGG